jgi:hypothetical protein
MIPFEKFEAVNPEPLNNYKIPIIRRRKDKIFIRLINTSKIKK